MYTEKTVRLKTDFYNRYGETSGRLYFVKVGTPCVIMNSGTHSLSFSLGCGVSAFGRKYGDILKILNDRSDVCDVHFVKSGSGAQILYSEDVPGMNASEETVMYAIEKLLRQMQLTDAVKSARSMAELCDKHGSGGWCALRMYDEITEIPLPLAGYNVLVIRTRKNRRGQIKNDVQRQFEMGETKRIIAAAEGLKKCRTHVLLDMVNESERSLEFLLGLGERAVSAVRIAAEAEGVEAARMCDIGVVCFCEKEKTDCAVQEIALKYEHETGLAADIIIAK